jgi:hypothetical protein
MRGAEPGVRGNTRYPAAERAYNFSAYFSVGWCARTVLY